MQPVPPSSEEIIAVVSSYIEIMRDPERAGEKFYMRMFQLEPTLEGLFKTARREQSEKFMQLLTSIVRVLNRPDQVNQFVTNMAHRHIGYGVEYSYFKIAGESLMYALKECLGSEFTPTVNTAWQHTYRYIEGLIHEAYQREGKA
jgi:hemoglobin-like flavoprotein